MKSIYAYALIIAGISLSPLSAGEEVSFKGTKRQEKVRSLQKELDDLVSQRDLNRSKAAQEKEKGDRWQFEADRLLDAKKAWQKSDEYKKEADALDKKIKAFKKKHKRLK